MHYYGTRLSENISRREPEGYLLCLNVPVARTGTQDYLPEELGLSRNLSRRDSPPGSSLASVDLSSDKASATGSCQSFAQPSFISVYRPEDEVFSPETMASFEGMPVTNDHPPEGVDVSNIRALQKGHAHNVRRGSGEESDLLLADLIITDPGLIDQIMDGKREISCGYTYELCEENGQYIQRKIRGNHVAVVDAGRAGPRVSIKDEHPVQISDLGNRCRATGARDWRAAGDDRAAATIAENKAKEPERMSRRPNLRFGKRLPCYSRPPLTSASEVRAVCGDRSTNTNNLRGENAMKKSLSKILARMARDGDIETVAEIIEEMIEPETAAEAAAAETAEKVVEAVEEVAEEPAAVVETPEGATVVVDEATLADVISRLDKLITLLTPAATDEAAVAEEIAEAVEEAIEGEALRAAGGGNSVSAEVTRNEQSPQWGAAMIEGAVEEGTTIEEISEMVAEIVDPVSEVIGAEEDECEEPEPEVLSTGDALRAALRAVGPALAKMPKQQRRQVCGDIAARLNGKGGSSGADAGIYAAMAAARPKPAADPKELGRRIMETRSANRARN